ncbi:DMT family transporter [Lentilactobacillus farraginis]|uniref:Membrane protein n=1 Tax=Lentilactobacillus farraginis DSM 18382 = JCM 14108 TaxID=1423743 RepID=X0PC23_9LACO|nr:DMT family transporter [Lentilactobacillus farraginis]KRM11716.1 membrane protein [Lentilactobacillus farraginis DSM 18382 = JCM 14108]GAF37718.1 putative inner membrane protein [Lentilactobacillus farraginis DSM 18382 = JCM 14108]
MNSPKIIKSSTEKTIVVPLLVVATILAGMLSPMQSAVNGQVGKQLGDGNASAVVSFGSGLVVMAIIILARQSTRRQFASIPKKIVSHRIPWWNWIAGCCGAMVVFSEGASASILGVATFQTTLISGMVISGLMCDRLGIGVPVKQPFNFPRILGAVLAIVATVLVVLPSWQAPKVIALAILPFLAGLLAGWQPAGNSAVAQETGSMLVSITWNFIVGFGILGAALLVRILMGQLTFNLPSAWWMYLGGPLGLLSIALMALLVRGLGLLLLGLASTAGQLIGSVLIDWLIPQLGNEVYFVTILGALVALIGAGIAMIPSANKHVAVDELENHQV